MGDLRCGDLRKEANFMSDNALRQSQLTLPELEVFPPRARRYPQLRYMGSKYRLLPWLHSVLAGIEFSSAFDAFSGSGCVAYLLKCMGKRVLTNDFLVFAYQIADATIANPRYRLSGNLLSA